MNAKRVYLLTFLLITCVFLLPVYSARACPSCYGAADSSMTDAMNMAIFTLLGVTGSVLLGLVAFFVYLRKRARMLNERFRTMLN
jgi:LPXTG-motif cell wall-anchored protein